MKPSGGWSGQLNEDARLLPSDGTANDYFGKVAIDSGLIVVGASLSDAQGEDSGAAYVFEKPVAGWSGTVFETEKLRASDGATGDYLGANVSTSTEVVVAGARWHDDNGPQSGAAFVFLAAQIFADGFESGDTTAWANSVLDSNEFRRFGADLSSWEQTMGKQPRGR